MRIAPDGTRDRAKQLNPLASDDEVELFIAATCMSHSLILQAPQSVLRARLGELRAYEDDPREPNTRVEAGMIRRELSRRVGGCAQ